MLRTLLIVAAVHIGLRPHRLGIHRTIWMAG